jgi:hypothetical protein
MAFYKMTVPTFSVITISAENQEEAYKKCKQLNHNNVNKDKVVETSLNFDELKKMTDEDFDMEEETINNPDFVFDNDRYNRFVLDMQAANICFEDDEFLQDEDPYIRTYSGRGMFGEKCPAVYCRDSNDISRIEKATGLNLHRDSLGLGIILYP